MSPTKGVYYNDNEPFVAQWLRKLIAAKQLPAGDVDERPIQEVQPEDVQGYRQAHFFAGIGGWPLALQLAGWPDDREVWTGSCPCPSFSTAGRGRGFADPRHLWPEWRRLIVQHRPPVVFGEQVAAAVGFGWWDLVAAELEAQGYAVAATVLGAHSVGAPHKRQRLWFVADASDRRWETRKPKVRGRQQDTAWGGDDLAYANGERRNGQRLRLQRGQPQQEGAETDGGGTPAALADSQSLGNHPDASRRRRRSAPQPDLGGAIRHPTGSRLPDGAGTAIHEPQAEQEPERPDWWATEPNVGRLADGIPARMGKLRGFGNAIVPQDAAEVVSAYLSCVTPEDA